MFTVCGVWNRSCDKGQNVICLACCVLVLYFCIKHIILSGGNPVLGSKCFHHNIVILCLYFFGAETGFALLILKNIFEIINFSAFTFKEKNVCPKEITMLIAK